MATAFGPRTSAASHGSRTMTITSTPSGENTGSDPTSGANEAGPSGEVVGVLRLRGRGPAGPRVQWTDETVDNEGLGRKKSKICCIYHKPKPFDESSDESSGSDSSASDNSDSSAGSLDSRGSAADRRRLRRVNRRSRLHHHHHHQHEGPCEHEEEGGTRRNGGSSTVLEQPREEIPEPNAYERGGGGGGKGKGMFFLVASPSYAALPPLASC
ncbi:hypothetical protein JCM11641_004097 [Rhodosporidiobolus odoratus]